MLRHVLTHVCTGMPAHEEGCAYPQEYTTTAKLGSHTRQTDEQTRHRPPGTSQRAFSTILSNPLPPGRWVPIYRSQRGPLHLTISNFTVLLEGFPSV